MGRSESGPRILSGGTGVGSRGALGDGYLGSVEWVGRAMSLHLRSENQGGMDAFLGKRLSVWYGSGQ